MLESISRQVSTVYFADLELTDQRVKTVLGRIPRDQFVPEEYRRYAYENTRSATAKQSPSLILLAS
jgi:protein-L-isoaspartate O-methyltransferase